MCTQTNKQTHKRLHTRGLTYSEHILHICHSLELCLLSIHPFMIYAVQRHALRQATYRRIVGRLMNNDFETAGSGLDLNWVWRQISGCPDRLPPEHKSEHLLLANLRYTPSIKTPGGLKSICKFPCYTWNPNLKQCRARSIRFIILRTAGENVTCLNIQSVQAVLELRLSIPAEKEIS